MTHQVRLVQIGMGNVGREVVRLLMESRERWLHRYGVNVCYAALLDTQGGVVCPDGIPDRVLRDLVAAKETGQSLAENSVGMRVSPLEALQRLGPDLGPVVLVDCAAGGGTYEAIHQTLLSGGSVVLSNKAPLAVDQERYDHLMEAGQSRLLNEATVGAGLPVLSTLRSLLDSGDEVIEIQACASGTLGYITSELMAGRQYSEAVSQARELGYTEPDPRDDLSGLDVARKALILARTFGRRLEPGEVRVEPLLPPLDTGLSVQEFMDALPEGDGEFSERVARAQRSGCSLKYVAKIPAEGEVRVELREAPERSQVGSLTGPDNIFVFRTREYREQPLTIIGPGAGPTNTAMGVLEDVLQSARQVRV